MIPIKRDISKLSSTHFDLLVIGAGINGSAIAWDAALRGLKVALIEKEDFGGATSAGCFKIVHGGVRYLQHFDFQRLFESVREQKTLRTIAPHLVHPLPFLVPCYGFGMKAPETLRLGMCLYELLSSGRNKNIGESHKLSSHQFFSKSKLLQIAPGVSEKKLRGGVLFQDCQMSNCDRLTLSVIKGAVKAGALVCNYLEATSLSHQEAGTETVLAKDLQTGKTLSLSASFIINATGPWSKLTSALGSNEPLQKPLQYSKGIQLVLPQIQKDYALALESHYQDPRAVVHRGARNYFITPWRGYSLIGTSDSLYEGNPDDFSISQQESEEFLADIQTAYHSDLFKKENILHTFGGLRPIDPRQSLNSLAEGEAKVSHEDEIIFHEKRNFLSVVGVKYTTFRALAEKVVDKVLSERKFQASPCKTSTTPLPGGEIEDYGQFVLTALQKYSASLPENIIQHLLSNYGTEATCIFEMIEKDTALGEQLSSKLLVTKAELIHAARHESVSHLSDVVFRRTGLGTLGNPGTKAIQKASKIVGEELGWSEERRGEEVKKVRDSFYATSLWS